jgi:hypothetical protein
MPANASLEWTCRQAKAECLGQMSCNVLNVLKCPMLSLAQ